jgi:ribosomal protein L18E
VVQRYGQGRTLCLLTGGTHRWVLSRDATEASRRGHGAFWRVIAAWLTTPPNRTPVALETDRDVYEVGETARVVVQVSDVGFQPVSSARVTVVARTAGAAPREIALAETAGSPGRYEGGLPLTASGSCKLTAAATLRGASLGTDAREIAVEPPRLELADPAQDVAFLRSIADASGGAYLAAEQASRLPELVKLVPHERQTPVHAAWARSAWALVILMLLLGSDWLLRRWWGVG